MLSISLVIFSGADNTSTWNCIQPCQFGKGELAMLSTSERVLWSLHL